MLVTFWQPEHIALPPLHPWGPPTLLSLGPENYLVLSKEIQNADSSLFNHCHQAHQLCHHKGTCHCLQWADWSYNLTLPMSSPLAMPESLLCLDAEMLQMPRASGQITYFCTHQWPAQGSCSHLASLLYLLDHTALLKTCAVLVHSYAVWMYLELNCLEWIAGLGKKKIPLAALQNLLHAPYCLSLL